MISIIIPVHNGGDNFRQCLSSLKQFAPEETEIIVVADGDTDVRVVMLDQDPGPGVRTPPDARLDRGALTQHRQRPSSGGRGMVGHPLSRHGDAFTAQSAGPKVPRASPPSLDTVSA